MAAANKQELLDLLARGDFDGVIGTQEGELIDFKSHAYNLDSPKGRRDLVADVATFANARGGVIVMGVETMREPESRVEKASTVVGVKPESFNETRYRDLINRHIYPLLRDLVFATNDLPASRNGRIAVAIVVEAQRHFDHPFIVDLVANEDETQDARHALGWPTRSGDSTHWESPARIQQLLSGGLRARAEHRVVSRASPAEDLEAHRALIVDQEEWAGWGVFMIHAIPAPDVLVSDFFDTFKNELRVWSGVRGESGFNLSLEWLPIEARGSRLLSLDSRTSLIIDRSGLLTMAAVGSPDFLGWAQHKLGAPVDGPVTINPFVITEFTFESIRFAQEHVSGYLECRYSEFIVSGERFLEPLGLRLRTATTGGPAFPGSLKAPTVDSFKSHVPATGDSGADAFAALSEVSGEAFGIGPDWLPFEKDGRVDESILVGRRE